MNCHKTMSLPCIVYKGTFSIYGGYVSEKFHDRKTTMLDVKTSWKKWGFGDQTYDT